MSIKIKNRLARLAKSASLRPTPPPPVVDDADFADEMIRFLGGESSESIAHSRGEYWRPWQQLGPYAVSQEEAEDEVRQAIVNFLNGADR